MKLKWFNWLHKVAETVSSKWNWVGWIFSVQAQLLDRPIQIAMEFQNICLIEDSPVEQCLTISPFETSNVSRKYDFLINLKSTYWTIQMMLFNLYCEFRSILNSAHWMCDIWSLMKINVWIRWHSFNPLRIEDFPRLFRKNVFIHV